jgi:tRNA pseudouridine55 synthase
VLLKRRDFNRLFVANKPIFRGSNSYLGQLKREYLAKKGGFSGTLDPFATGSLIVAFGSYTKLFRFFDKSRKVYRATLWLGTDSSSLDIENRVTFQDVQKKSADEISEALKSLVGEIEYVPPKFSAKWVDGERAYDKARRGEEVVLKSVQSTIYTTELLNYSHPFIHFEIEVSEGSYIRSIGSIIAKKLGTTGVLSSLHRVSEGNFYFNGEKALNPLDYLRHIAKNSYLGDQNDILNGKKLRAEDFEVSLPDRYIIQFDDYFSIIEIEIGGRVEYLLNRVPVE